MMLSEITAVPVAVRVFPVPPPTAKPRSRSQKRWRRPDAMFVWDTETRIDTTQCLTFGSYRVLIAGACQDERLFYADDLTKAERDCLLQYAKRHHAAVSTDDARP